jgi:hypothetical protein
MTHNCIYYKKMKVWKNKEREKKKLKKEKNKSNNSKLII